MAASVALSPLRPDHEHFSALFAGVRDDIGGSAMTGCRGAIPNRHHQVTSGDQFLARRHVGYDTGCP